MDEIANTLQPGISVLYDLMFTYSCYCVTGQVFPGLVCVSELCLLTYIMSPQGQGQCL